MWNIVNNNMVKYRGLSTDTKPSVEPGSEFFEMDTGKTYMYDGSSWNEQPASGGGGDITVVSLTASSNATYSAPSGKAYDPVIVNVPATPAVVSSISISANGTYSAPEGVDGYNPVVVSVPAFASAITITENGTYSAPVGVDGYNPVVVSVSGGGGGDVVTDEIIARTISGTYTNSTATKLGDYAFNRCTSLTGVNFTAVTTIAGSAFTNCSALVSVSLPSALEIGASAFTYCSSLKNVFTPLVKSIRGSAFGSCSSLATISFPEATTISAQAFRYCESLESAYFLGSSVPTLSGSVFNNTPMSVSTYIGKWGSILVKESLLATFKTATNWATWSARMVGLTDAQIAAL